MYVQGKAGNRSDLLCRAGRAGSLPLKLSSGRTAVDAHAALYAAGVPIGGVNAAGDDHTVYPMALMPHALVQGCDYAER